MSTEQILWAAIQTATGRQSEMIFHDTIRRTRREAIAAYDEPVGAGTFDRNRKAGIVRVGRVIISPAYEPEP